MSPQFKKQILDLMSVLSVASLILGVAYIFAFSAGKMEWAEAIAAVLKFPLGILLLFVAATLLKRIVDRID